MAKGKHGAAAAQRRAEAAHEHIDRLTDQLVEVKTRARRYESDAMRVPALEAEIRRLREQVQDGSSNELERERQARENDRVLMAAKLNAIARLLHESIRDRWLLVSSEGTAVEGELGLAFTQAMSHLLGDEATAIMTQSVHGRFHRRLALRGGDSTGAGVGRHRAGKLTEKEIQAASVPAPVTDETLRLGTDWADVSSS